MRQVQKNSLNTQTLPVEQQRLLTHKRGVDSFYANAESDC